MNIETNINKNVEKAISELKKGNFVILVDDKDRENEGDLVFPAEKVTGDIINFMCTFGKGLICLALDENYFDRLGIPMMVKKNSSFQNTAYGVPFEAANGVTTGISPQDRAKTIQVAVDEQSRNQDIVMPGHMFPLKAAKLGIIERQGHTEASTDLMHLAGFKKAAVICEIIASNGEMARGEVLLKFAKQHKLTVLNINDLKTYILKKNCFVHEVANAKLPVTLDSAFNIKIFKSDLDKQKNEHIALIHDKIETITSPPLVRIHSECITGDVFGSLRCDCGKQIEKSMKLISKEKGIIIYLRQEGRGIGLSKKIEAYSLQDNGLDTVDANLQLGFASDLRDYIIGAQILKYLGFSKIKALTNNPEKIRSLMKYGVNVVKRVPLETEATSFNKDYLKAKKQKLNHIMENMQ